jgi:hypothetical protein
MYLTCDCCKKRFYMPIDVNLTDYVYKKRVMRKGMYWAYYCSYTCWRNAKGGRKKVEQHN